MEGRPALEGVMLDCRYTPDECTRCLAAAGYDAT